MIVKNILAAKRGDVVTIEATANLAAAVKLLTAQHIGAVVILGAGIYKLPVTGGTPGGQSRTTRAASPW